MGWFGGLVSKAKKFVSGAVEKVKSVGRKVKEKVTNTWGKVTGKNTFKEAERLYQEITDRYNNKRNQFDKDLEVIINSIDSHVTSINESKGRIKQELFIEMSDLFKKIQDISIDQKFTTEMFKVNDYNFESIRGKEKLYKIDFNKMTFKVRMKSIFTFGAYSRKKAKETLYAVQEEESKLKTEMAKMDAELKRLKLIDTALGNVEHYFTSLIDIYEQLLVRLDNSVHYLYFQCMTTAHNVLGKQMSIKKLPIVQRREIEAIITASTILKSMVDAQIISVDKDSEVVKYDKNLKVQHKEMMEAHKAA